MKAQISGDNLKYLENYAGKNQPSKPSPQKINYVKIMQLKN